MYSFHHVALSVRDSQVSEKFYEQLGFRQVHFWAAQDGSLTITHLRNGVMMLELFCYREHTEPPASIYNTKTDLPVIGTKHFGLRVESAEVARREGDRHRGHKNRPRPNWASLFLHIRPRWDSSRDFRRQKRFLERVPVIEHKYIGAPAAVEFQPNQGRATALVCDSS